MFLNLINPLFSFFPNHGTGDLEIGDAYELADKIKAENKKPLTTKEKIDLADTTVGRLQKTDFFEEVDNEILPQRKKIFRFGKLF